MLGTRNQHPVCGLKPFTNAVPKDQCIREGGHESNTNVVAGGERHKVANSSGSRRQEGKRRSKKNVKNKKASAASRKGAQKRAGQLNVDASMGTGGLALSKSENNIFEKSSKLSMDCGTGAGNRLFSAYEGLVTSMRDLQLESGCEQSPNQTMNDFSRTQVLNMIAVSREVVGLSECGPCENGDDACPVDLKGSCKWFQYVTGSPKYLILFCFSSRILQFHIAFITACATFIHLKTMCRSINKQG